MSEPTCLVWLLFAARRAAPAVVQAVNGLLIEIGFIITFTKRFFGAR